MAFGAGTEERIPAGRVIAYLLGVAILAGSLTLLFLSMRAVLEIGGACASGGPYVPSVECPDAVVAVTPLSIFAGIGGVLLMLWGGSAIPGPWAGLVVLLWPALFLSLGWNFLEYGFFPPDGAEGWVWSWIFCGVLFVLMGGIPLVLAVGAIRDARAGRRADADEREYAGGRVVLRPRPGSAAPVASAASAAPGASAAGASRSRPTDLVDRLERLADLRRRGDLSNEEFDAAKRELLRLDEADAR